MCAGCVVRRWHMYVGCYNLLQISDITVVKHNVRQLFYSITKKEIVTLLLFKYIFTIQWNTNFSHGIICSISACLPSCVSCVDQATCTACLNGYFLDGMGECSGKATIKGHYTGSL